MVDMRVGASVSVLPYGSKECLVSNSDTNLILIIRSKERHRNCYINKLYLRNKIGYIYRKSRTRESGNSSDLH